MTDPYRFIGLLLRTLPPEAAHGLVLALLERGRVPGVAEPDDPVLSCSLWGRELSNPIGLAAGFDKDGRAVEALLSSGFGLVEVGTVTPRPQSGNPKPRIFRLPEDEAVINRLGFNSEGAEAVARRLRALRELPRRRAGLIGVNLGRNRETVDAAADYAEGAVTFAPLADYLVVNVSSPNTPGLRELQRADRLAEVVGRTRDAVRETERERKVPLLVKIAPDLDDEGLRGIAEVGLAHGVDGIIVGNTTVTRPAGLKSRRRDEEGGLSGRPLMRLSTEALATLRRLTRGRIPLVGTGGVASGADAYAKIRAGASLVQLYTALVFRGPGLVRRIKADLARLLARDGYARVLDAVGADVE